MNTSAATYEGTVLHESITRGRASGCLQLFHDKLIVETDEARIELPLDGIQLKLGGASDRLIFFSHDSHPGWSVFTADHRVLKDSALYSRLDLINQIGRVRSQKRTVRIVLASTLLLIAALLASAVVFKDHMIRAVASNIPISWETKLGDVVRLQIETSSTMIDDPHTLAALDKLLAPLVDSIGDSNYEFKFHIVDDSTLNAFAIPGGHVFLHTGLIQAAETPEEILGVIAHEIGHVTERHSMRQLAGTAGLFTVVQAFLGDTSGLLAVLMDGGLLLTAQKFSRDHEREADAVGWEYLTKANVNPAGLLSFFEHIREEEEKMGEVAEALNSLAFLNTHPATEERMESLKKKLDLLDPQPISLSNDNLAELQERIGGLR